jgi:hypothetical protein
MAKRLTTDDPRSLSREKARRVAQQLRPIGEAHQARQRQELSLARYAALSDAERGRLFPDPEHRALLDRAAREHTARY